MYMSFRLEMDRRIVKGSHYISPGGFCIKFTGKNMSTRTIEFDFLDYKGNIVDEKYLDCCLSCLDTESFKGSEDIVNLLGSCMYEWQEFFVYTGERSDAEINPVKATNIVLAHGDKRYKLKDFIFPDSLLHPLSPALFTTITGIMNSAIRFCAAHQMIVKGGEIRFFEDNGKIILCTKAGNGYYYDTENNISGALGFMGSQKSLNAVKGLVADVVTNLIDKVPFPVKSITIPYGNLSGGYYKSSLQEYGSFDIVLK